MSRRLARLAAIAILAGAFSGLFGVGGGGIMVPLLVLWIGYEEREATGTSLAAIVIIAGAAALVQGIGYGKVDVVKGIVIGIPAVAGVIAGTALQQRVPTRAISGIFAVVLVVSAITLVIQVHDVLIALALGFAGGVASGMLGIGGGALFVPGLVIFLDVAQVRAEATSLMAIVPVAIVGAYRQNRYGNLRPRDALVLGVLALPGVLIGTGIANVVSEHALAIAFACVQLVFAVGLARRALGRDSGSG